jgi:predicted acetyltransferase
VGLELRELRPEDEAAFLATVPFQEKNFAHYYEPGQAFTDYLRILRDRNQGLGLPPGHVPSTLLFGFIGDKIVGRLSIRHELTDFLEKVGGHIGYVVLEPFRRQGHATEMMGQSYEICRSLGLGKVLLTCDEANEASRRTIEKCGGKYESTYSGPGAPAPKRRYWIAL